MGRASRYNRGKSTNVKQNRPSGPVSSRRKVNSRYSAPSTTRSSGQSSAGQSGTSSRGQSGTTTYGSSRETRESELKTKGYAKSREGSISKPQPNIDYKSNIETVSVVKSPGPKQSTKYSNYTGPSLKESLNQSNIDKVNTHYANSKKDTTRSAGPTSSRSNRSNKRNVPENNSNILSSAATTESKIESPAETTKSSSVKYRQPRSFKNKIATQPVKENKNDNDRRITKLDSGSNSVKMTYETSKPENKTIVLDSGSSAVNLAYTTSSKSDSSAAIESESKIKQGPKDIVNNLLFPDKPDIRKGKETPAITWDNLQDKSFAGKNIPGLELPGKQNLIYDNPVNDFMYGLTGAFVNIYHDVRGISEGIGADNPNQAMSDYHTQYHTGDIIDYLFQKTAQIANPDESHPGLALYESENGFFSNPARVAGSLIGTAATFLIPVGAIAKGVSIGSKSLAATAKAVPGIGKIITSSGDILTAAKNVPDIANLLSKAETVGTKVDNAFSVFAQVGLKDNSVNIPSNFKAHAESALGGEAVKIPEYKNSKYEVWESKNKDNDVVGVAYEIVGKGKGRSVLEHLVKKGDEGTEVRLDVNNKSFKVNTNSVSSRELVFSDDVAAFNRNNPGFDKIDHISSDNVMPNTKDNSKVKFEDLGNKSISGVVSRESTPETAIVGITDNVEYTGKVISRELDVTGVKVNDPFEVAAIHKDKGVKVDEGSNNFKNADFDIRDKNKDKVNDILKELDKDTVDPLNPKGTKKDNLDNTSKDNPLSKDDTSKGNQILDNQTGKGNEGLIMDSLSIIDSGKKSPAVKIKGGFGIDVNPFLIKQDSSFNPVSGFTDGSALLQIDDTIIKPDQGQIFKPDNDQIFKPDNDQVWKPDNKIIIPEIIKEKIKIGHDVDVILKSGVGFRSGFDGGLIPKYDIPYKTIFDEPKIDIPTEPEIIIPPIIPPPIIAAVPINDKLAGSRSRGGKNNKLFSTNSDHSSFVGFVNTKEISYGSKVRSKLIKEYDFSDKGLLAESKHIGKSKPVKQFDFSGKDNLEFTTKELFTSGKTESKNQSKESTNKQLDFLASKSNKSNEGFSLGKSSNSKDMSFFSGKSDSNVFDSSTESIDKMFGHKKNNKKSKGFSL